MDNYFNEKEKYYLNSQKYWECQLVTAINAAIFLTELPVLQNSVEYERLVDLVMAREGAAIRIGDAHRYLRIVRQPLNTISLPVIKKNLDNNKPVELHVYHKKTGRHSVLVIEYCKDMMKVLNFSQITNEQCWVKWIKLKRTLKLIQEAYTYTLDPWYIRNLQIKNNQRLVEKEKNGTGTHRTGTNN